MYEAELNIKNLSKDLDISKTISLNGVFDFNEYQWKGNLDDTVRDYLIGDDWPLDEVKLILEAYKDVPTIRIDLREVDLDNTNFHIYFYRIGSTYDNSPKGGNVRKTSTQTGEYYLNYRIYFIDSNDNNLMRNVGDISIFLDSTGTPISGYIYVPGEDQ